jgi:energy-coupling factor transporter ATP-binding protein EcfA2
VTDPRLTAFLSPLAPEIFHSVQHRHEIWREDPFDVGTLHPEARDVFSRLLVKATTPPGLPSGRILLILGESGSGKTHLLRAFRNQVHGEGLGYVGYMQMTSATQNYGRYMLNNLIDSLDQPYNELLNPTTSGLMRLAGAVASRLPAGLATALSDEELEVHSAVLDGADAIVRRYDVDLDLVRALLYLNRDDAIIKSRVLKYLRCERYGDADAARIGGLPPRTDEDDPLRLLEGLGKLCWLLGNGSLVLCLDQLEDIWNLDEAKQRFRQVASALTTVMDRVPSSLLLISCLEDYWKAVREYLTGSLRDRIEEDPEPVRLVGERSLDEARALVARRVAYLYERAEVEAPADSTYPFDETFLGSLARRRTRDVLDKCRRFREKAMQSGVLTNTVGEPAIAATDAEVARLEQSWNDFLAGYDKPRPEDEPARAELLAWAIGSTGDELESGHQFAARVDKGSVVVDVRHKDKAVEKLLVRLCDRSPRGGALMRQVVELRDDAGDRVPVMVRATDFPSGPRTQVAAEIGKLISAGGRRAVLEDSALKTMMALREFRGVHYRAAQFDGWLRGENPLSQMPVMRAVLALDKFGPPDVPAGSAEPVEQPPPPAPPPPPPAPKSDEVVVGRLEGLNPVEVTIRADDLRRHAAFLGGTGSGKSTLVMNIVEDLLLRGVPVILVDRKGDLCGHARPELWTRPLGDEAREAHRARLRERIDVQVFTPGSSGGRPLSVPLVPDGIGALPADERADEAALAAHAIGGMLDYKHTGRDKTCRAILIQAVTLLAQGSARVTVEALIRLVADEDPVLVNAVGRLDTKLFSKVVQDLETFRMTAGKLLVPSAEMLDLDALFGTGRHAGARTRLSVVSTKFMDTGNTLFWVAQLLLQAYRWAVKRPSPDALQGAILLDEADLYLPATSQPATKQPMENLLKRARSAGLSVLLATQNPGDLDYKCRDNVFSWFVGKVTQPVSINKMRPMLAECRIDVSSKLASRRAGQFFLLRNGDATPLMGRLPAILPDQIGADEILALAARRA